MADNDTANLDGAEIGRAPISSTITASSASDVEPTVPGGGGGMSTQGKRYLSNEVRRRKRSKEAKPKTVGIMKLFFKYASIVEMLHMFLGTCFAVLTGWVYQRKGNQPDHPRINYNLQLFSLVTTNTKYYGATSR